MDDPKDLKITIIIARPGPARSTLSVCEPGPLRPGPARPAGPVQVSNWAAMSNKMPGCHLANA